VGKTSLLLEASPDDPRVTPAKASDHHMQGIGDGPIAMSSNHSVIGVPL
jgi:hypothetical protein